MFANNKLASLGLIRALIHSTVTRFICSAQAAQYHNKTVREQENNRQTSLHHPQDMGNF